MFVRFVISGIFYICGIIAMVVICGICVISDIYVICGIVVMFEICVICS